MAYPVVECLLGLKESSRGVFKVFAFVALLCLCQKSRGGHLGLEGVLAFLLSHCEVRLPTSKPHYLLLNLHVFYGCFGEQCLATGRLKPFSLKTLLCIFF